MEKLRDVTLVYLIKREGNKIKKICLAMKKRSFGVNRWNGVGGKVDGEESIEDCAKRESKEEIGVEIINPYKVAELSFYFPHKIEWNQKVHVYFTEEWDGEPTESEEMNPDWFDVGQLPYDNMWSSDRYWLPQVLDGKYVEGKITFKEGDIVQEKEVNIVEKL